MAYNPPVKGSPFAFRVALPDAANPPNFKTSPTIAAGDFKVDKDGAGLTNLATLPTVSPSGSCLVSIELSGAEMTADVVTIVCKDASGGEWCDVVISIPTVAAS